MITHKKQCSIADNEADNPDIVNPSDWNDTHDVDVDALNALIGSVLDLGNISGAVNIDLSYSAIKFNLVGNATFTFINPPASGVNRPTTFYGTRTSGSNAVLTLPTISWTSPQPPSIIDVYTTVFSVSTLNAGTSYFGFANGISLEVTGSGLATTWNPSDSATATPTTEPLPFAITDGNTKIERTGAASSTQNVGKTARAFGGKSSGKHRFSVVLESAFAGGTSQWAALGLGVSTGAVPLTGWFADTATGFAVHLGPTSTSQHTVYKENNNVQTVLVAQAAGNTPTSGTIFSVLVDFDANKIWFARNGVVLGGGNPEAGTGQDFNVTDGAIFFPSIAMSETGAANTGIWKLLNEVSDPYAANFPSFNYWTA